MPAAQKNHPFPDESYKNLHLIIQNTNTALNSTSHKYAIKIALSRKNINNSILGHFLTNPQNVGKNHLLY